MRGSGSPWRFVKPSGKTHSAPWSSTRSPSAAQLVDHHGEQRVVRALPGDVVVGEQDAEHRVDLVDVPQALGHEDLPESQRLGIPALEEDHTPAAALGEVGVAVEVQARLGVELVEVAHAERLGVGRAPHVDQVLDEHAEGRAPVPDVVLAQHLVAEKPEDPGERVADHRAAQVPDVHLLGHVGRRVVDHDPLRVGGGRHPQAVVGPRWPRSGRPRTRRTGSG